MTLRDDNLVAKQWFFKLKIKAVSKIVIDLFNKRRISLPCYIKMRS